MTRDIWNTYVYGNAEIGVKGLVDYVGDLYLEDYPEVDLIVNVVASAGKERDLEYFNGEGFKFHAWLLRLDSDILYSSIRNMWRLEDAEHRKYITNLINDALNK